MALDLTGKVVSTLRLPTTDYSGTPIRVVAAEQGDINSRFLRIMMYDDRGNIDKSVFDIVVLQAEGPDETPMAVKGEIKEGFAFVELTPEMLATDGQLTCNLVLGGSNAQSNAFVITSQTFYVYVSRRVRGFGSPEDIENHNILISLIQRVSELESHAAKAESGREAAESIRVNNETLRILAEQLRVDAEALRVVAEQQRATQEGVRQANEVVRQNNETERQHQEQNVRMPQEVVREQNEENRQHQENNVRVPQENQRVIAEGQRATAESQRATSETTRQNNESVRQSNEVERQFQETEVRQVQESQRVAQESTRQTNETERQRQENEIRIPQENVRQENEQARIEAETLREQEHFERMSASHDAEEQRRLAELQRVEAEGNRAALELVRQENEGTRQNQESDRVNTESQRAESEEERNTAEGEREDNENERIENEQVRIAAEAQRATQIDGVLDEARDKAKQAVADAIADIDFDNINLITDPELEGGSNYNAPSTVAARTYIDNRAVPRMTRARFNELRVDGQIPDEMPVVITDENSGAVSQNPGNSQCGNDNGRLGGYDRIINTQEEWDELCSIRFWDIDWSLYCWETDTFTCGSTWDDPPMIENVFWGINPLEQNGFTDGSERYYRVLVNCHIRLSADFRNCHVTNAIIDFNGNTLDATHTYWASFAFEDMYGNSKFLNINLGTINMPLFRGFREITAVFSPWHHQVRIPNSMPSAHVFGIFDSVTKLEVICSTNGNTMSIRNLPPTVVYARNCGVGGSVNLNRLWFENARVASGCHNMTIHVIMRSTVATQSAFVNCHNINIESISCSSGQHDGLFENCSYIRCIDAYMPSGANGIAFKGCRFVDVSGDAYAFGSGSGTRVMFDECIGVKVRNAIINNNANNILFRNCRAVEMFLQARTSGSAAVTTDVFWSGVNTEISTFACLPNPSGNYGESGSSETQDEPVPKSQISSIVQTAIAHNEMLLRRFDGTLVETKTVGQLADSHIFHWFGNIDIATMTFEISEVNPATGRKSNGWATFQSSFPIEGNPPTNPNGTFYLSITFGDTWLQVHMERETYQPLHSQFVLMEHQSITIDNPFAVVTPTKVTVFNAGEVVLEHDLPSEHTLANGASLRMASRAKVNVYQN